MKRLKLTRALALLAGGTLALCSGGCVARAGVRAEPPPIAFSAPPTLVHAGSDVWVVYDYGYPVYYVDGDYWAYRDDVHAWYRADSYDASWVYVGVDIVPARIRHRDHRRYVHYRGSPGARVRRAPDAPALAPASRFDRPRGVPAPPRAEPRPERTRPPSPPPVRRAPERTRPSPRPAPERLAPSHRRAPEHVRPAPRRAPERVQPAPEPRRRERRDPKRQR